MHRYFIPLWGSVLGSIPYETLNKLWEDGSIEWDGEPPRQALEFQDDCLVAIHINQTNNKTDEKFALQDIKHFVEAELNQNDRQTSAKEMTRYYIKNGNIVRGG